MVQFEKETIALQDEEEVDPLSEALVSYNGDTSIVKSTEYLVQFVVNVILLGVGAETAVKVPVATPRRK